MDGKERTENCIRLLDPKKQADKAWFLSLLDDENRGYELSLRKADTEMIEIA